MNSFLLLLIMSLLPIKLNAFSGLDVADTLKLNETKKNLKASPISIDQFKYKLEREEILKNDNLCLRCPKHLLLTEKINKIVEAMAKDPKINDGRELPLKINRLKFLFYTVSRHDENGKPDCQRFMDITPDAKPTTFDGQFQLMAEDALSFSAVTDIYFANANNDEEVYYYRGEGDEKNIVVQAIMTKEGGKLRYFRYTPTEKENNPYNLPDLDTTPSAQVFNPKLPTNFSEIKNAYDNDAIKSDPYKFGSENMSIEFMKEVEMKNKYIPKDIHFMKGSLHKDIGFGLVVDSTAKTSVSGFKSKLALKGADGNNLLIVHLEKELTGKHAVSIPYSIRVLEESNIKISGKIADETNGQIVTMGISDDVTVWLRSEYRKNKNTDKESYVLARDIPISPKEIYTIQLGHGEDKKSYTALTHTKKIKDNITLILGVRLGEGGNTSVTYGMQGKF